MIQLKNQPTERLCTQHPVGLPANTISILNLTADLSRKRWIQHGLATSNVLRSEMYFYEMKLDSSRLLMEQALGLLAGKTDNASGICMPYS